MTRRVVVGLATTLAVAAIGYIDIISGRDYGMALFYLGPVVVAAWYVGMTFGIALATAAAAMWVASELAAASAPPMSAMVWNGFTRLAIFVGAAILLSALRKDRMRLREMLAAAQASARTDALTGLLNTRGFYERLRDEQARIARHGRAVTLAYVDLDNFKRVNDAFGHIRGDEVLTEFASLLRTHTRAGDVIARLGGDEFAIAMVETAPAQVEPFEQRLREAMQSLTGRYPGLGASVGLVELTPTTTIDDAVRRADAAMYSAKAGRKDVSGSRSRSC